MVENYTICKGNIIIIERVHLMNIKVKKAVNEIFNMIYTAKTSLIQKVLLVYIYAILGLYPLFLYGTAINNILVKIIIFSIWTIITAVIFLGCMIKQKKNICSLNCITDYLFIAYFIYAVNLLIKGSKSTENVNEGILIMTVAVSYWLASNCIQYKRRYLEILFFPMVIVFIGVWGYFLLVGYTVKPLQLLMENFDSLTSYIILAVTISSIFYCTMERRKNSILYLMMCGSGFFFIFSIKDGVGMFMILLIIVLIPILYKSSNLLIKRTVILITLYFVELGIMGLLVYYGGYMQGSIAYNIESSVLLNLALAAAGISFYAYWEKHPNENELKKIFKIAFVVIFSIAFIFRQYYLKDNVALYNIYIEYGMISFLCMLGMGVIILRNLYVRCLESNKDLLLLSGVFIVQSMFYMQQSITTPIYVILLAVALHSKIEEIV